MTSWPVSASHSSSAIWSFSLLPDVATSATALRVRSGSAKCCWYAASRAGRAIQNPILPNIRLASLEAGTLRQVLRTEAFNQAAHASTAGPTRRTCGCTGQEQCRLLRE